MTPPPPAFCINCGAALTPDTVFCEQCGCRIGAVAAEPQPAPFVPPPPPQAVVPPPPQQTVGQSAPPAKRGLPAGLIAVIVLVAAAFGVGGFLVWEKMHNAAPAAGAQAGPAAAPTVPVVHPATAEAPPATAEAPPATVEAPPATVEAPPATAEVPPNAAAAVPVGTGPPPVEVAYIHFMNEVHGRLGGKLSVGSPKSTPSRIEVKVIAEGKPETVVVLEKSNTGSQATVLVGPKDAGAVRSYSLTRTAAGWSVAGFEDLDG